jgi:hypothetical protein
VNQAWLAPGCWRHAAGETGSEDQEGTRKHKKRSLPSVLIVYLSLAL